MSQQHISQFLQTCSNAHAFTHAHTHTHLNAQAHNMRTYGPTKERLYLAFLLKIYCFVQPKSRFDFFSPQEKRGWAKGSDHSHFLTEQTIGLPRSEIGSSEKHTIRNHYSAPNCCWQAWVRQMRKWKDYNTISLSCTHLLIHLPVLNKCIYLKMIWQTIPTSWIRDTEAAKKKVTYLYEALHCKIKSIINLEGIS